MNRGSNLRPRGLVIAWAHELFSSPALKRDLQRLLIHLANPDQQTRYETGSQRDFATAPVDERARTEQGLVPKPWRGRVPDPLYRLFLDASHRLTLDPRFFPPGEDSAARGRRLTRFAKMKRPIPAQGPRLNARIVGLCKEDRTCTVVVAPPGTVDPLAELGERQVRPGFAPLVTVWPG